MMQTLTTRELAERLRVSPDTVRRHAPELGAYRLGRRGHFRFRADEVEDLLERARGGGTGSSARG